MSRRLSVMKTLVMKEVTLNFNLNLKATKPCKKSVGVHMFHPWCFQPCFVGVHPDISMEFMAMFRWSSSSMFPTMFRWVIQWDGLSQVLSGGESCQLSSDGVRDSAGYGHRSICPTLRHEKYELYATRNMNSSARLHRHASSADRGTSRHSGRCDWIVSRVNSGEGAALQAG